jgi:hypothetical protein
LLDNWIMRKADAERGGVADLDEAFSRCQP